MCEHNYNRDGRRLYRLAGRALAAYPSKLGLSGNQHSRASSRHCLRSAKIKPGVLKQVAKAEPDIQALIAARIEARATRRCGDAAMRRIEPAKGQRSNLTLSRTGQCLEALLTELNLDKNRAMEAQRLARAGPEVFRRAGRGGA
jgi:hypothetical protein